MKQSRLDELSGALFERDWKLYSKRDPVVIALELYAQFPLTTASGECGVKVNAISATVSFTASIAPSSGGCAFVHPLIPSVP
jgi:hypothetical protein